MTAAPLTNRQRAIQAKPCTICGDWKPLDEFTASQRMPDGRKNQCKACSAVQQREARNRLRLQQPAPTPPQADRPEPRPDRCPNGCGRWPTRPETGLCERHHQVAARHATTAQPAQPAQSGWERTVGAPQEHQPDDPGSSAPGASHSEAV